MMLETKGRVLLKGGAEGVMTIAIPGLQMGIALKALDGNSRATEYCTSILLQRLGLVENSSLFLNPKIKNWNNIETGSIRLNV
jgi:L-asparaginase II